MIEFSAKDTYNVRKTLEDADFRHFAKQLAYRWADYYAASKGAISQDSIMSWMLVEEAIAAARFWNILNAEFAYDLSTWLKESKFVANVPSDAAKEYEGRFSVDPDYIQSLPESAPKRYSYEQYFVYREICKALGVDPDVTDEE